MPDGFQVPKSIQIGKISKTICKYNPVYIIGEYKVQDQPVVWMLNCRPPYDKIIQLKIDISIKFKYCGQIGRDANSEDRCMVFEKY